MLYLTETGLWSGGASWPDFAAWCTAHPGRRARVAVGASALSTLVAPADLPLGDEAALRAYARLQFTHYFGTAAQGWPLATWWRGVQRGASALTNPALDPQDPRLTALQPSWCLALRQQAECDPAWAAAGCTALALVEGQALTWMLLRDGQLAALQQRVLNDGSDEAELQTLLLALQQAAGDFSHAPKCVGWSGADIPGLQRDARDTGWMRPKAAASRWPAPDFVPARNRPGLLASLWLLTALAACALGAQQALQQRDEAARLDEQAQLLARITAPPQGARPAASAAGLAARDRAQALARRLDTDWPALWLEVEQALPPGIQLLGLDLEARQLRVEGSASQADTVMQLVDRLAQQSRSAAGEPQEVVLTRLQKPERAEDAAQGLRFEIVRRPAAAAGARP